MSKHDALNGGGSRCNGVFSQQAGDQAQRKASTGAQPVTAATGAPSPSQLRLEQSAMAAFVRAEFNEFIDHTGCGDPGHQDLARIDADRAVLARMVDLDDAVAQRRVY